jgi:hypothetical protein
VVERKFLEKRHFSGSHGKSSYNHYVKSAMRGRGIGGEESRYESHSVYEENYRISITYYNESGFRVD